MVVLERLNKEYLLFDGAMGTMLQLAGLKAGELPEVYNMKNPEIIVNIHKEYLEAGADIITTNTFGANRLKLGKSGYGSTEIVKKAVSLARQALEGTQGKYVALDIGPIGTLLSPLGTLGFEEAYDIFKEQVIAGRVAGADLILIETMSDLYETKAAVLAAKENADLPVFCTMTFEDDHRTFAGTDVLTMVNVLEGLGVDVLGVNCSRGPGELRPVVEEILKNSSIPVMVQANAGLPLAGQGAIQYDISPEEYASQIQLMAKEGVSIFGGCCGTNPEYISMLSSSLGGKKPSRPTVRRITACSSSTETVIIGDQVRIIGERINPTGKKILKEALRNNDLDYVVREAITQKETGSDILDINVGLPDIDEKAMMVRAITEIQSVLSLPLQIDSADVDVIEAALRIYNGKPIVNSVNGKRSNMEAIFPLVKKYGALVIGLTLDEDGIPKSAEKRVEIASKIIETAHEYGIAEENILIDPLVLTASAEQANVMETLRSIGMIKAKYKVRVVLGTSNVSFGLPNRPIINNTYLAMALSHGLDAPITDSKNTSLMDTIRSFKVLTNQDRGCRDYIQTYSNISIESQQVDPSALKLDEIIIKGLKEEASRETARLLEEHDSLEIVNSFIIPALDIIGLRYEKKEIFLPQLIRSAETAKQSFQVIKEKLVMEGSNKKSSNTIVLATVEGDIHDLGKNIVKLILENYGYEIIDLGKDVSADDIVSAAKRENSALVGLSALMTTTVGTMENTIKMLRNQCPGIKVMVGGAVLTPDYANSIGADYYAKDAREGVDIAKRVFGS